MSIKNNYLVSVLAMYLIGDDFLLFQRFIKRKRSRK